MSKLMKMSDTVTAPLGIAHIVSRPNNDGEVLVCYSRKDYSAEDWRKISPQNGPCRFIMYKVEELSDVR